MSHVYRLHTNGANTLDGWDASVKYSNNEINNIVDPAGGTANLPITSVPTPFASLELTRNAYEVCAAVDKGGKNNINGTTIYHKLVSFSLDILEIFFNFKKFSKIVQIIPWNSQTEIANLLNSSNNDHQRLGQTLNLYMQQDSEAFNFDRNTTFYILNYINGPAPLNIIGGTSPTTLTVASTNDLWYVNIPLSGNHNAFDADSDTYRSLMQRDPEFIKYVWTLTLQYNFSAPHHYFEVYKYVQECFKAITDVNLKNELRLLTANDIDNYEPITVGAANMMLSDNIMLGMYQSPDPGQISDFTILSDFKGVLPLVLPNELGYNVAGMKYVTGQWNPNTKAPYFDERSMDKRTLPNDNTQYPYLTADDVFQPYIIRTIFPVDDSAYFLGHYKSTSGYSYLLPLKEEIFKYLSPETISGSVQGVHARNIFELRDIAGNSVEAIINIPIQKGQYITFRRKYLAIDNADPQIEENRGVIVTCRFDLFLYPSYHIVNNDGISKPQRVYLIDGDWKEQTRHYDYSVKLLAVQNGISEDLVSSVIQRADKANYFITSKIFVANDEFDLVKLSNGFAEGMLIPKYKSVGNGSDSYEFAIDFGTTNTHIEYCENNDNIVKPLEMSSSDSAVLAMHPNEEKYKKRFLELELESFVSACYQEFLPTTFGADDITGFPLRTNVCLSKANGMSSNIQSKVTLGDYGIGFHYEHQDTFEHNQTKTNLKWLGGDEMPYIKSFFEELLLIVRSKVLLNGGSLKQTCIKWFYPVSMETFRLSQLSDLWDTLCHSLISPQCKAVPVTESLAPFYYYKNTEGVSAAYRPVVLMDIGGGTTDFAIYENNHPAWISSVRFAGNSIYGDFPGFGISMNGFYNRYKKSYEAKVADSQVSSSIRRAFDNVVANGNSADFVSFLYSLEKNAELKKHNICISFSDDLKKDYSMKTCLLLFFVGEIYYLAHLLKAKDLGTPAYLTISGTGSKVLDLIGGRSELESLSKIIFNDIIGDDGKVELKQVQNPKEITCKGGLKMTKEDNVNDCDSLKYFYAASEALEKVGAQVKLKDVDDIAMLEVASFYSKFIDYFFGLNRKFSFEKKFGINTQLNFAEYKEVLLEHTREDLAAVLDARRKATKNPEAELEDSLFFFPLAGGLNRLAYYISNQSN